MKITLDYGTEHIHAEVPRDRTEVLEPKHPPPLRNIRSALIEALRNPMGQLPLRSIAKRGANIGISVCDITRAQPRQLMVEAIIEEMPNVRPEDITIFIATGTHRSNTSEEINEMLGDEIASSLRVVNHNARDESSLQRIADTETVSPVLINREWMESDVRITTGFVEPHFFAGFSGGPKMVAPGLAGIETVMILHNAERIAHPKATWGITYGNPIHDDVRQIAESVGVHFAMDVTLDRSRRITGVFAGNLVLEHTAACKAARLEAMQPVPSPFDVVLTSNSGYPLDQNLYQAVKGMSAAGRIVKHGGIIICAAECRYGIPEPSSYADILRSADSPAEMLHNIQSPGYAVPDQWEAQIQALIQSKAVVKIKADGLTDEQIRESHLEPVHDLTEALHESLNNAGNNATLCVLPQGPQTIPYIT